MVEVGRVGSVFSWRVGFSVRCRLWEGEERYLLNVLQRRMAQSSGPGYAIGALSFCVKSAVLGGGAPLAPCLVP